MEVSQITIKTERFLLRKLEVKDASLRYLSWFDCVDVKTHILASTKMRALEDLELYIEKKNNSKNTLFFGIFCLDTGLHIGNIKYEPIDFIARFSIVGILIGEENWRGRGVATEVIKHSSMWLHERFNMEKIVLSVNVDNIAAVRAYEKADFKKRKTPYIEIIHEKQLTMVLDFK